MDKRVFAGIVYKPGYWHWLTSIASLAIFTIGCRNIPVRQTPSAPLAITPDSLKIDMTEEIDHFIRSGFYDDAETVEQIQDMFYDQRIDLPWIKEVVAGAYKKRLAEQASWPKFTDFDKLVQVFDQLNAEGIIALHKAGNTREDGEEDAAEIHETLGAKGIKTKGYCFYHSQDVDRAVDGHTLLLAFGDFDRDDHAVKSIGERINDLLSKAGFTTDWNHSTETRINITKISWQKRFGNGNSSYEHAKSLLSRQ